MQSPDGCAIATPDGGGFFFFFLGGGAQPPCVRGERKGRSHAAASRATRHMLSDTRRHCGNPAPWEARGRGGGGRRRKEEGGETRRNQGGTNRRKGRRCRRHARMRESGGESAGARGPRGREDCECAGAGRRSTKRSPCGLHCPVRRKAAGSHVRDPGHPVVWIFTHPRGSLHCATQAERLLPKLLSRGEWRSPLKYIMSIFCQILSISLKKFGLSTRIWVSILSVPKFLLRVQTLGAKSAKKYCHVGILKAFHLWTLCTSVKAERLDSHSLPIKLLDFLHLSTDKHSMKPP